MLLGVAAMQSFESPQLEHQPALSQQTNAVRSGEAQRRSTIGCGETGCGVALDDLPSLLSTFRKPQLRFIRPMNSRNVLKFARLLRLVGSRVCYVKFEFVNVTQPDVNLPTEKAHKPGD